jgi:glycosyltransferase involved in cell wall biosynthesis
MTAPTPAPTPAPTLCIGMPAWNEAASIEAVVRESLAALDRWPGGGEVLVVDDGSEDDTPRILAALAREDHRLRVVTCPHRGLAPTLETLKREVRGDYAFLTASDGEWSSMTVLDMLPAVQRGADVVVGRRKQKAGYTPYRQVVSAAYNGLSRVLFGVPTWDAGSQRLFRTRLMRDIPRTSRSVYADAEFLIRCQYLGYRVEVVDVDHRVRPAGKGRGAALANVVAATGDMLRLWRRKSRLAGEGVRAGAAGSPR